MRSDPAHSESSVSWATVAGSWMQNVHRSQGEADEGSWPRYRWGHYGMGACETWQVPPHLKGGDCSATNMLQGWYILPNLWIFQDKVEMMWELFFVFFFLFFFKKPVGWIWLMDFQFFHIFVEGATSTIPLEFTTYWPIF